MPMASLLCALYTNVCIYANKAEEQFRYIYNAYNMQCNLHASSYNVIDYAEISGDGYYGHLYLMLFADLFVARSWFDTLHEKLYLPS